MIVIVNNAKKYFIYFDCFVYFAEIMCPAQSRQRRRLWKLFGNPWLFFALPAKNAGVRLFFSGAVSAVHVHIEKVLSRCGDTGARRIFLPD